MTRSKNKGQIPVGFSTFLTDETPQHTLEFQKMERCHHVMFSSSEEPLTSWFCPLNQP